MASDHDQTLASGFPESDRGACMHYTSVSLSCIIPMAPSTSLPWSLARAPRSCHKYSVCRCLRVMREQRQETRAGGRRYPVFPGISIVHFARGFGRIGDAEGRRQQRVGGDEASVPVRSSFRRHSERISQRQLSEATPIRTGTDLPQVIHHCSEPSRLGRTTTSQSPSCRPRGPKILTILLMHGVACHADQPPTNENCKVVACDEQDALRFCDNPTKTGHGSRLRMRGLVGPCSYDMLCEKDASEEGSADHRKQSFTQSNTAVREGTYSPGLGWSR
ncbi:hypothetical protein DENSPDRAFT_226629 [Dentipellis sp. KUC8613]|nr:hypothetical protein DENSPDRAFT_226629 [Dentipellis sp. KUC8613]